MILRIACFQIFLYLIFFQTLSILFAGISGNNYTLKRLQIRELPNDEDLLKYLRTIEAVTAYNTKNVNEIEINLAFGVFLNTVNLGWVLKEKECNLPWNIKTRIRKNIFKNEQILNYFNKVTKDTNFANRKYKQISKLFTNASIWVDHLQKFVYTNQKFYTLRELEEIYPRWDYYLKDVDNVENWTPSPEFSDMCMVSLSIDTVDKNYSHSWCSIAGPCYKMLNEGTDFGYALTHRALLLLMAYFGRGCTIFSPTRDKDMMATFCSMGYAEAEYIAMNNYKIVDLMMEIMCLCSLEGEARFLRRSWLNHILYFQKPQRCFGTEITKSRDTRLFDRGGFNFKSRYSNSSDEECNSHTTALALGIYSAAIRYVIQEYY